MEEWRWWREELRDEEDKGLRNLEANRREIIIIIVVVAGFDGEKKKLYVTRVY